MARKLWWGSGSPWCMQVQIVLEEKKLPYESILISFSKREHKSEEILSLNPRGQVPTFDDGGIVVNESGAACEYLEAAYPQSPKLIPDDIKLKAKVYQLMWESSNLSTLFREIALAKNMAEEEIKSKKDSLKKELAIWEGYLKGKTYLIGDEFTMADVFLIPKISVAVRFGLNLSALGYSSLADYYSRATERESVVKSWPPHWKEGPAPSIPLATL